MCDVFLPEANLSNPRELIRDKEWRAQTTFFQSNYLEQYKFRGNYKIKNYSMIVKTMMACLNRLIVICIRHLNISTKNVESLVQIRFPISPQQNNKF